MNTQPHPFPLTVDAALADQRLDVAISQALGLSRSQVQKWITDGRVQVDGQVVAKRTAVTLGQVITLTPETSTPTVKDLPAIPILYVDEDLMVVDKPAGLAVHTGAGVRVGTLVDALIAQGMAPVGGPEADRPGIVHRIDRDTSGLLAIARSERGYAALKPQFEAHSTHREYWALCQGILNPPSVTIDAPILRSPRNRTTFVTGDGGRPSVTHVSTLATHQVPFRAGMRDLSEVVVTLETGRTHQVRVHLRALHLPLVADEAYGADMALAKRLGITRHALHARRLAFRHPDGHTIDLSSPVPEDLLAFRKALG